jgi:hypothetical protein
MFVIVNWNQRRQALGAGPSLIFSFGLAAAGVSGFLLPAASATTAAKTVGSIQVNPRSLAQDDEGDQSEEVAPAEIEKYVAVYKAMQRDHGLSVERATAQQGMSLPAFRQLENRIGHDNSAREQARKQLQSAANESASPTPSGASSRPEPSK